MNGVEMRSEYSSGREKAIRTVHTIRSIAGDALHGKHEQLTRRNNNSNDNGTIIIMIIKQFESHAIASYAVLFCQLFFAAMRLALDHYPQWNCLNGHNHNQKCVVLAHLLVDWIWLVSAFDDGVGSRHGCGIFTVNDALDSASFCCCFISFTPDSLCRLTQS